MLSDHTQHTIDTLGAKTGTAIAMTGGSGAVVAGINLSDWGVIAGIVIGVLGLLVQLYFKWREDQRQVRYWNARREDGFDSGEE